MKSGERDAQAANNNCWRLEDLSIDARARTVHRAETRLDLPPLSFQLLLSLVEANGRTLSSRELEGLLWPGKIVGADVLKQRVSLLRRSLGTAPHGQHYIETDHSKGYRIGLPAHMITAAQVRRGSYKKFILFGFLSLLLLAALVWALPTNGEKRLNILVTPLTVLEPNGVTDAAFAAGLSMELATRISSLPGLKAYFGPDLVGSRTINAVLTGQIKRSNDKLRVLVNLIDPNSKEVLWGGVYDRPFSDIFDVQRDISWHISFMLLDQVDPEGAERLKTGSTSNYQSYALFVQALGAYKTDPAGARGLLEEALLMDPSFKAAADLQEQIR